MNGRKVEFLKPIFKWNNMRFFCCCCSIVIPVSVHIPVELWCFILYFLPFATPSLLVSLAWITYRIFQPRTIWYHVLRTCLDKPKLGCFILTQFIKWNNLEMLNLDQLDLTNSVAEIMCNLWLGKHNSLIRNWEHVTVCGVHFGLICLFIILEGCFLLTQSLRIQSIWEFIAICITEKVLFNYHFLFKITQIF